MKLTIQSLSIQSFKGIKQQTFDFNNKSVDVLGRNGSGKSTLFSAYSWVFSDTDSLMTKNPVVIPLGETECTPTVELEMLLDDKPLKVSKKQKFKSKKVDGKVTSSSSNTYAINDVEKSYKDFVADLTARGIDIEHFLMFSNPNAFMADTSKSGRDKMRKVLFDMASDISDIDLAKEINASELTVLLEDKGYTLEEAKATNKSLIKKITDNNGRENEIINARISGILESKATVDVKALNDAKTLTELAIKDLEKTLLDSTTVKTDIQREIAKLENTKADILRQANAENEKAIAEKDRELVNIDTQRASVQSRKRVLEVEIDSLNAEISRVRESLENYRNLYKKVQDEVLNEDDLKCPTCGREYEAERIEEIQTQFEESKNERLNSYKTKGEELNKTLVTKNKLLAEKEQQIDECDKEYDELSHKIESLKAEISMMPTKADSSVTTDIDSQISKLEEQLVQTDTSKQAEIETKLNEKKTQLTEINNQLALAEHNSVLDAQAEKLREQRTQDEINKANAEKVLSQIETIERTKNERLTEEINSHFNIVKFKLFDFLKNGHYAETIELLIDDKPISSCANGSLIQLAKLDCLSGLQNYFNQHLPVFLDDAALITSNTGTRIQLDSQLIKLIAAEGVNELEIKEG